MAETDADRLAHLLCELDPATPEMRYHMLADRLVARGVTVPIEPSPPRAVLHCSYCDRTSHLTDVRVVIAEAEEGFADIMRLVCENHLDSMTKGLRNLGFRDHRHGGINFLEDPYCPGFNDMALCPTPETDD